MGSLTLAGPHDLHAGRGRIACSDGGCLLDDGAPTKSVRATASQIGIISPLVRRAVAGRVPWSRHRPWGAKIRTTEAPFPPCSSFAMHGGEAIGVNTIHLNNV